MQGLELDMKRREGAAFLLDAADVRLFLATGLGGDELASALSATAAGVTIRTGAPQPTLLLCPAAPASGLSFTLVQR